MTVRTTALPLMAGSQVTGRMVGQEPGRWLIRDAFDEHFLGGATAFFNVLTCENKTLNSKKDKVKDDAPVRKYYIAAEEVDWDYAPSGEDKVGTGGSQWSTYATRDEKHIGTAYKKARFIEYTDERFTDRKPRDPEEEHLGILGPLIKAAVGDRITVVFRNKASRPYSMFAQAVKYDKDNEGFQYNDGTSGQGSHVQPNTDFTYEWSVPKRWSPLSDNDECVVSMYHSATDPVKDVHTGLVGPLMICNPRGYNRPRSDYYPDKSNSTDYRVSADFFLYMSVIDENKSWYLQDNVKTYAPQADTQSKSFRESNRKHSINGYIYGNMPILDACYKHRYQINVITLGDLESVPSAYVNSHMMRTDNSHPMSLHAQPGVSKTGMLDATSLGTWLVESLALGETSKGMAGYMKVEECMEPGQYIDHSRPPSVTRQYYIAAVEMDWDYAPFNYDFIREMPLWKNLSGNPGYRYVGLDGTLIGSRYRKAVFREYVDANFTKPKPQTMADLHFGLMGPVLRAENGDVIKVVFKNLASRPYSIRALGLQVNKTDEGYKYKEGGSDGSEVRPMETFEYTWSIPYSHSVSFGDGWCELRVYHSAVDSVRDINSGLIGPITVCSKGHLKRIDEYLSRKFPRVEFFFLFHTFDENLSWYFKENLQKYADNPSLIDTEDEHFRESNRMHSINGRIYGNLEGVVSKRLSSADVHLMSLDTPTRPHSINFHVRLSEGKQHGARMHRRTVPMYPGTTTSDEKYNAFKPGAWLVKSVMMDQYEAGMALIWDIDDNFHDMVSILHKGPGSGALSFWDRLNKNERIFFIIGVVGAVLLLFLVCYCMCMKARKRSGQQRITDPTPRPV